MRVRFDASVLRQGSWQKQAARFLWGGTITVLTGLLAKLVGPRAGGLFLAFPAILPLSLVMLARRENTAVPRRRTQARGRHAAVAAAAGAALGAPALVAFALVVWLGVEHVSPAWVLAGGGLVWCAVALLVYATEKRRRRR